MIRGLYTSAWSMLANSKEMDVISNNLANVNTNAYKRDDVIFETFPSVMTKRLNDTFSKLNPSGNVGNMELGSDVGEVFTYYLQGQMLNTNNSFDLAIQDGPSSQGSKVGSEAFFTVEVTDANGQKQQFYTRDGSFTINSKQQLVTKEGYPVMGENGPITLSGEDFSVQPDGTIIQDDKIVDKLLIKEIKDTSTLRKTGSNLVTPIDGAEAQPFTGIIRQGFIEQSNVNIVKEMVNMINVTRAYESSQKALQAQDGTLEKVVNEVGSVR